MFRKFFNLAAIGVLSVSSATVGVLRADDYSISDEFATSTEATWDDLHSHETAAAGDCYCEDCKPLMRLKSRLFLENIWSSDYRGAVPSSLEPSRFSVDDSRIGVEGWLRDDVWYRAEMGFVRFQPGLTARDDVDLGDFFIERNDVPIFGNVRSGHFLEPFSLERQSRKEVIPLMERSSATTNFAPGRNLGVMAFDHLPNNENVTWFLGGFAGNRWDDLSNSADDDLAVTGRLAWLPFYDDCCNSLLHIGLGATARRTGDDAGVDGNGRWLGRVPLGLLRSLIGTQLEPNIEFNVYNLELAMARGPLTLQAEAYHTETNTLTPIYMSGAYAQAAWILTGEHRQYDRVMKAFDRVHPLDPVLGCGATGRGAWELIVRYSYNDLNDVESLLSGGSGVQPPTVIGDQNDFTVGTNWYLNSHTRMMFNYVHSHAFYTFIGSSTAEHYGVRMAWDY